jgi:alkylation response protein AidB-like acyl-CoA dehydrogenase
VTGIVAAGSDPSGHQVLGVAAIRSAIKPVLQDLAASAPAREQSRGHPFEEVRELARRQLLLVGIATDDGGAGGTVRDVVEVVIDVARADSNVAQALRPSFLTAHVVAIHGEVPHRQRTLQRLSRGELFAFTANERNGGASGSVSTTVRRSGHGYVLNGAKYYSTGGLYAHWFGGTAVDDDGETVEFTVSTTRDGVRLVDDFDAVGQRLTASGTTELRDVVLSADEVIRPALSPTGNPWTGTFAQLYLAAIQAGIAGAALDDAVAFGSERARPIKHSTAETSSQDPYVRHVVGEIASRFHAARATVLMAAEQLEAISLTSDEEVRSAAAAAAITVAQTQFVAAEAALRSGELVFDVGGGSATDRAHGFDRHWRNARTVANHNPRDWKLAVVGGHHLADEEPPTTGLF